MARKRRRRGTDPVNEETTRPALPAAPVRLARPFADALAGVKATPEKTAKPERPAPPTKRAAPAPTESSGDHSRSTYEDRVALSQALAGVSPLSDKRGRSARRVTGTEAVAAPKPATDGATKAAADAVARARLASLVAGGLTFDVRHDEDGHVEGARRGAAERALGDLRQGRATPEAEIDLHGLSADEAEARLVRFVQSAHRAGKRIVLVVHGKGLHSEGGSPVLGDRVVRTLTSGTAAPAVLAFVSAARQGGGTGALLVRLEGR